MFSISFLYKIGEFHESSSDEKNAKGKNVFHDMFNCISFI